MSDLTPQEIEAEAKIIFGKAAAIRLPHCYANGRHFFRSVAGYWIIVFDYPTRDAPAYIQEPIRRQADIKTAVAAHRRFGRAWARTGRVERPKFDPK